jgi:prophage tail gpP-like protein
VSVALEKSAQTGTVTTLELTDKRAFDVEPLPPAKPKGGGSLFDLRPGEKA